MLKERQNIPKKSGGLLNKTKDFVKSSIDSLFQQTYNNPIEIYDDMESVRNGLDTALDAIRTQSPDGELGLSNAYEKIYLSNVKTHKGDDMSSIFADKSITDNMAPNILQNKLLKKYDAEIDALCKVVPSLNEALEVKADHVLSADSHNKDFLICTAPTLTDAKTKEEFDGKIESYKKQYKLVKLLKDSYKRAARYGEEYLYVDSYKEAFSRLLQNKDTYVQEQTILCESGNINEFFGITQTTSSSDSGFESCKINLRINSGAIPSAIQEQTQLNTILEATNSSTGYAKMYNNFALPKNGFEGLDGETSTDGTFDTNKKNKDSIKVNGAIVKRLKRENLIPKYINDVCIGYYYVECDARVDQMNNTNYGLQSTLGFMGSKLGTAATALGNDEKDKALIYLSSKIAKEIDSKFINNNQDIKKELYMILQQNEIYQKSKIDINISYISPKNIVPIIFNEDEESHRGMSDLENSMIPGKLYASLYISNTLGMITRGFDKRVYYVKNQIDSNISQIMLNSINQIKRSNFGIREVAGSLKNTLNVTGRYNDLLIPTDANGESPIRFEMMPGQDIDPKQDTLEQLEQQAINAVHVPYEYVQALNNVDFATRLTMSNVKFSRIVLSRQQEYQEPCSRLFSLIWYYENNEWLDIIVKFPPPAYLNLVNTLEIYQYVSQYADAIVTDQLIKEEEGLRKISKKNIIIDLLGTIMDNTQIKDIMERSRLEYEADKEKEDTGM